MTGIDLRLLADEELPSILPLLQQTYPHLSEECLRTRLAAMPVQGVHSFKLRVSSFELETRNSQLETGDALSDLNCYVTNSAAHAFWMREGYGIVDFHFQQPLTSP